MKGYSLLELSIVVVIIALLMAGVTMGNTILKKAKLYGTIKELKEIESAIILFKEQYSAYPGDFSNAYYYFGVDDLCGTESQCNGDGDEIIEIGSKHNSEVYRSFQHLSSAELLKQYFSGVWGERNSVIQATIGGNYTLIYDENFNNIIKLGAEIAISGQTSDGSLLFPKDAEKIDQKIDDGMPLKGDLRAKSGTNTKNEDCITKPFYNVIFESNESCIIGLKI